MDILRDLTEHMYVQAEQRRADPQTNVQEKYLQNLSESIAEDRRFATVATTGGTLQRQVVAFLERKHAPRKPKKVDRVRAAPAKKKGGPRA